jgi:beta-lactam-binding protein with PASTA domain
VIGLTLARAKVKLRKARCGLGPIRRARSRRIGRVIRQSPKPGAVKARGFKVRVVVGRR